MILLCKGNGGNVGPVLEGSLILVQDNLHCDCETVQQCGFIYYMKIQF